MVKPKASSQRPSMVSCGMGLGLPRLGVVTHGVKPLSNGLCGFFVYG
nr:hypothetical protein [Gilliamella apis]